MSEFNIYGDRPFATGTGHGMDVAIQREDKLDRCAIERIALLIRRSPGTVVRALDAACAAGGQARRMARAGAVVTAVDLNDHAACFERAIREEGLSGVVFVQADLRRADLYGELGRFDVIVAQRFIHYLPYPQAVEVVKLFRNALLPEGRLYLSASGLHSELGRNYDGAAALAERFSRLWQPMADKHGIDGRVCLYDEEDMRVLLQAGGMHAERVYASPFGNIKSISRAG